MTFEEYVAARLPALLRYAVLLTGDPHLAEDLVQDVLIRAHGRWRRIVAGGPPDRYVQRMVTNAYLSWRRRWNTRRVVLVDPPERPAPGEDPVERDENGMWQDKGLQPNGTLLGRPSRYSERDGRTSLHVYGVQGMHISVNAATDGRPELDRATVERIVRGLRLVDSPDRPADWTDRPLP